MAPREGPCWDQTAVRFRVRSQKDESPEQMPQEGHAFNLQKRQRWVSLVILRSTNGRLVRN